MNNPLNELTTSQQRELYEICWRYEQQLSEGKQVSPSEFIPADCSIDSELLLTELNEIQNDWLESAARRQSNWPPVSDQRYELREEIARGGSAVIWRVWDKHLQRETALKCLLETQDNEAMRARLEREARLCARLVHPGIVPVHELAKFADGRPFVNMKLVEGKTLLQLLTESPPISRNAAIEIFTKVCEAMAYAHNRAIIHRDLKPSNIMVGAFGEVQIMDWGLGKDLLVHDSLEIAITGAAPVESKVVQPKDQYNDLTVRDLVNESTRFDSTKQGCVIGTLAYMSPEQARGNMDRVDRRSDVFALGAILCRILIGTPPYQGLEETQILQQAQDCNLREIELKLRRSPDKKMAELAIRCMRSDPNARPADAEVVFEFISEIHSARRRRKVGTAAAAVVSLVAMAIAVVRWSGNSKLTEPTVATVQPQAAVQPTTTNPDLDLTDPATIDSLFTAKQHKLLLSSYRTALAKHPANYHLTRIICASLLTVGRFDEAEPVAHALVKLGDQQVEPYFLLGDSLYYQGKYQDACDVYTRCKAVLDNGAVTTLPVEEKLASARRKIEIEKQIEVIETLPIDTMSYDEIAELARVSENSRIKLSIELYDKALATLPDDRARSYSRYQIIVGFQRVFKRNGLSQQDRNMLVEGLLGLLRDQYQYAVTDVATDPHGKAELVKILRHGDDLEFLRTIPGDQRVAPEIRERFADLLKTVAAKGE